MNDPDIDLTKLGRRKGPEPHHDAIEAAKRSALDAFDMAAKKISRQPKEPDWPPVFIVSQPKHGAIRCMPNTFPGPPSPL